MIMHENSSVDEKIYMPVWYLAFLLEASWLESASAMDHEH
jgi:hypothetical protein